MRATIMGETVGEGLTVMSLFSRNLNGKSILGSDARSIIRLHLCGVICL